MNKEIFTTTRGKLAELSDTVNAAGGLAYKMTSEQALVQYAVTGCFNDTFYTAAKDQLETVLKLVADVNPEFIAQTAVYARQKGFMKDMPAFLAAVLATKDVSLLKKIFPVVLDNGLMVKRFAHIIRTGVVGRKSFGTAIKSTLLQWVNNRADDQLFRDSVGGDVTLADLIKMIHPTPVNKTRSALYAYLIGKEYDKKYLPKLVKEYESFKSGKTKKVPNVPFQFLASLNIDDSVWKEIAKNAPWQMTRMNLNTFARHNVFKHEDMAKLIAERLRDKTLIKASRVFPYQLMAAYAMTSDNTAIPKEVTEALQDAMEIAVENVPEIEGNVYIFPDVSGSMHSSITGDRGGATSKVRCIDVAGLIASVFLRSNKNARVIPFEGDVVSLALNGRDSIMTNAKKLADMGGGSTNCSAPLALLNQEGAKGDLCIYVSDNESWFDTNSRYGASTCLKEWEAFRVRSPKAKLVCIDLTPTTYSNVPTKDRHDILNVGGFSDSVFTLVNRFASGTLSGEHLVGDVKKINLNKLLDLFHVEEDDA